MGVAEEAVVASYSGIKSSSLSSSCEGVLLYDGAGGGEGEVAGEDTDEASFDA